MKITLTITAKGQITLREEVLRHLGATPGDKITVDLLPKGRAEIRAVKSRGSIAEFIGCLREPVGKHLTIDQIAATAEQGWAGRR